jgi:hypothetical protein
MEIYVAMLGTSYHQLLHHLIWGVLRQNRTKWTSGGPVGKIMSRFFMRVVTNPWRCLLPEQSNNVLPGVPSCCRILHESHALSCHLFSWICCLVQSIGTELTPLDMGLQQWPPSKHGADWTERRVLLSIINSGWRQRIPLPIPIQWHDWWKPAATKLFFSTKSRFVTHDSPLSLSRLIHFHTL